MYLFYAVFFVVIIITVKLFRVNKVLGLVTFLCVAIANQLYKPQLIEFFTRVIEQMSK